MTSPPVRHPVKLLPAQALESVLPVIADVNTTQVQPLRIQKGVATGSPSKTGSSLPRPLVELSPTERRRNSLSFHQTTKKIMLNGDSSPFQSSPFNDCDLNSSPRLFWQGREHVAPNACSENVASGRRAASPSPTRRTSIEKLQLASRVKNSNMFAREQKHEYDPLSVVNVERPLAKQLQGNAYGGAGLEGLRSEGQGTSWNHKRSQSKTNNTIFSSPGVAPVVATTTFGPLSCPSKDYVSPTKSSMSSRTFPTRLGLESENGNWSEDQSDQEHILPEGKRLHRYAKSVTFDAAPPQINEYEMATPDLSSVGTGSRENSVDTEQDDEDNDFCHNGNEDSFDDSLEDTDKTPVVGPDDWSRSIHSGRHQEICGTLDDPFSGPHESPALGSAPASTRDVHAASVRTDTNEDCRPLPPLPGPKGGNSSIGGSPLSHSTRSPRDSLKGASISKLEIQNMSANKMPLEERLRLMMIQEDETSQTAAEQQRERRMRRAGTQDFVEAVTSATEEKDIPTFEDADISGDFSALGDFHFPDKISRESILRKLDVKGSNEVDHSCVSPVAESSSESSGLLDPDIAIPTTENEMDVQETVPTTAIKAEEIDEEIDIYTITEMYQDLLSKSHSCEPRLSFERDAPDEYDAESQYSEPAPVRQASDLCVNDDTAVFAALQPLRADSPPNLALALPDLPESKARVSRLELGGLLSGDDFGLGLQSYMESSTSHLGISNEKEHCVGNAELASQPLTPLLQAKPMPMPDYDGSGWGPLEDEEDCATPDSVIRHPIPLPSPRGSPTIPDQIATIKTAAGSRLKTRPSITPSDVETMREARRQVSSECPDIPPIPARHRNRPSINLDQNSNSESSDSVATQSTLRSPSFTKKSLTLSIDTDPGLNLDKALDRVMDAQKRGYLMRQNTKVVVASSDIDSAVSSRDTRSAGNSPVKQNRPQSWTVEPWNGRRKSVRDNINTRKKQFPGPVPALPGHESNTEGLAILAEDQPSSKATNIDTDDRGRLFVKVMGVKDLDLPLPRNERAWFSLTLDNGVHCVTTAWLELAKNAPIGQEFELVVPNELEFQLTLNAKLERPEPKRVVEVSPSKTTKAYKPSTFSRVFTSPKKRKESEIRQKEEEQRQAQEKQREAQNRQRLSQPTAWDILSPLSAEDGSFGRSYVCLKDHESRCFGRPYVVDVACFNEWATQDSSALSSVKSKRGNTNVQRKAPYKIGKLEVQLLFVPKPVGAKDEDMPKSMNSCVRELKEAELARSRSFQGHLSQQGGDCPYWRRRFFKLIGTKLTAYHESTGQPRATINLANASKLIDDRRALMQKETTGKGGSRRKSGFAEEEEGYMFVEEGFRIRFSNGEIIDFYADSTADKDAWMRALDQCIGKEGAARKTSKWCDLVLLEEDGARQGAEQQGRKASDHEQGRRPSQQQRTKSMIF